MKRFVLLLVVQLATTLAHDNFPNWIPNGNNVRLNGVPWPGVGHMSPAGGDERNAFGLDVKKSLKAGVPDWNYLCPLDSDGDGLTNGEELGDPDCVWEFGQEPAGPAISHPGFDDNDPPEIGLSAGLVAHGTLMILAWGFFAPCGTLFPLTQKKKLKTATPRVIDWFVLHKLFMVTATFLTYIAFVVAVWEVNDFKVGEKGSAHTNLGLAIVVLAVIQPLGGVFRVHVDKDGLKSNARLGWEFCHQWLGRTIIVMGVANIVLGLDYAVGITEKAQDGIGYFIVALLVAGSIFSVIYVFCFRNDQRFRKKPQAAPSETNGPQKATSNDANDMTYA